MPAPLAKVPLHHTAPPEPQGVPDECPRCGASLEDEVREVNLTVTLDDGAECSFVGFECPCCAWCCLPAGFAPGA
jgi:hypothetical protein